MWISLWFSEWVLVGKCDIGNRTIVYDDIALDDLKYIFVKSKIKNLCTVPIQLISAA